MQVIPIRSDAGLDERALLMVYDAHLVSRSLSQSDLLRFGTGRLLEDFIAFANPASERKIVFIGDPYMLSFGSSDDSAINVANLQTICEDRVIHYYHQPACDSHESCKESLKCSLAKSMDAQLFNNLNYTFDDGTIVEIGKDAITDKMKEWFMAPLQQEPKQSVLFFKKSDCLKTNLWVKHHCLNNGKDLASGDLLIADNNICIPDETGFGNPERVLNGMYFTVNDVLEKRSETISINNYPRPVLLSFTKISVKCLSLSGQDAEIWVLDNYLNCTDELAKEEQTAINVFIKRRIAERKQLLSSFAKTEFYSQLLSDADYQALSNDEKEAIENIIQNRLIQKGDRVPVKTTKVARSLLKCYYDRYESDIQRSSRENDPLINVLYARYAWAITVHKAVGSEFNNVILKGFRKEDDGICNESYFRWLYSGLSVAAGVFYIAQPQYVHPFMNCTVSETDSGVNPPKQLLIYDGYKVPSRFSDMVALNNVNVSAAICELAKLVEPSGYILEEVKPCNDFLTKAVFSVPQGIKKKLIIDFHNKGAKDSHGISAISMEPNELVDATCINQAIETVFSQAACNKHVETPEYILELVKAFGEQMKERGFKLDVVSSKDYQIVCKVTSNNGNVTLRLWYGTSLENHSKGFINKIDIFDITDTAIADEVREMILTNRQNYN